MPHCQPARLWSALQCVFAGAAMMLAPLASAVAVEIAISCGAVRQKSNSIRRKWNT